MCSINSVSNVNAHCECICYNFVVEEIKKFFHMPDDDDEDLYACKTN